MEAAKTLLAYDPETGVFTWLSGCRKGRPAGTVWDNGYIRIRVNGRYQYAHRLAWFFVHGYAPKRIDHINNDRKDNRIVNLRECTNQENLFNSTKWRSPTTSKFKGVYWHSQREKWAAHIHHNGKKKSLGLHTSEESAARAYDRAARARDSVFAGVNFA